MERPSERRFDWITPAVFATGFACCAALGIARPTAYAHGEAPAVGGRFQLVKHGGEGTMTVFDSGTGVVYRMEDGDELTRIDIVKGQIGVRAAKIYSIWAGTGVDLRSKELTTKTWLRSLGQLDIPAFEACLDPALLKDAPDKTALVEKLFRKARAKYLGEEGEEALKTLQFIEDGPLWKLAGWAGL